MPEIKKHIKDLNEDVRNYLNAKYEYLELRILKKSAKEVINLIRFLLLGFFSMIILLILSFAIAFLIGERMNSISTGFFIVAGFYFLIFLILLLFGKNIFGRRIIRLLSKEAKNIREALSEIFNL